MRLAHQGLSSWRLGELCLHCALYKHDVICCHGSALVIRLIYLRAQSMQIRDEAKAIK